MKNCILILAAFAAMTVDLNAQLGLKVGVNASNVYDSQGEEFTADGKLGLALGGFAHIPIGNNFGVQPEVLFSQKGFVATGRLLASDYKITRTTSYIDVPIFLAIKPASFLSIVAGPQFSFLVHQKDVFDSPIGNVLQEQEFENEDVRKNLLSVGAGFDINIKKAVIGLRGCLDVQNNNGDGTSSTPRYKNAWFQATVGYKLF